MENDGESHRVSLFVAFDTPNQGANVPTGLIELRNRLPYLGGALAPITDVIPFLRAINTPAARQMLIHHQGSSPHPDFSLFYQALNNLGNGGYPSQSRNVALLNGSLNGNRQLKYDGTSLINPGDMILNFRLTAILALMSVKVWTNNIGSSTKVYEGGLIGIFNGFSSSNLHVTLPINRDRLPGGFISYGTGDKWVWQMPERLRFTFIPTYSGIDYKGPLNSDGNFTFPISGSIINAQNQVTNPALTPFSAIYGLNVTNTYHAIPEDIPQAWDNLAFRELGLNSSAPMAGCLNLPPPPPVMKATLPARGNWTYSTLPAGACKYTILGRSVNNVITLYLGDYSSAYEQFIEVTGPNSYYKRLNVPKYGMIRVNWVFNDAPIGTYNIRSVRQLPGGGGTVVTSRTFQINSNCRIGAGECPTDEENGELIGILTDTDEPCYATKVNGVWIAVLDDGTFVSRERLIANGLTELGANCYAATDPTGSNPASSCPNLGSITYQRWEGIGGGTSIEDLLNVTNYFQNNPTVTQNVTLFEGPVDVADSYGARIRGYVCPPTTGLYTFWIAGDNNVELWLSTDDTEDNSQLIAYHDGWTPSREWNRHDSQRSYPVTLQAGQKYYIEARMKEGDGGDNLAVGWQLPNGALERPIPGSRLIPIASGCNLNISVTPSSVTTTPNGSVTLNASCSGDCSGVTYSWSGNGINGTGTQKTFNAPGSENNYTYTVTASKNGCSNKTANATVIVQNTPSPINLTLSIWRAGVLGVRTKIQDINNGDNIPISALNGGEANWFIDIAGGQISSSPGTGNYNHVSLYLNGNGYSNQGWGPENVINAGLPPYGLHGRDWGSYPPVGNNYQLTGKVFFNGTELASKTVSFHIVSCTPPSAPSISITQGSTACSSTPNNSVTLTATGCGGTVTWYRNGSQVATGSATHNTNIPGSYTATCTSGGCSSGFSSTVNVAQTSGCGSSPGNCYTLSFKGENPKYVSNHNGILKVKQADNSDSQVWKMEDAGSGFFKLVSQGSTNGTGIGKVLGVRNQGSSDEDIIDLQTSASGDHQLWSRTFLTGDDSNRYKIERKGTAYRISSYRMWGQGNLSDGESDLAIYSDPGDVFGWNKWTFTQKTCPGSGSRLGLQAEGVFENENTLYNLTVAPNPSGGSFEASFYLSDEVPARLVVSDMLGRTWHDQGISGKGSHLESIRLPREASGIFVVILRSATGTQTRKIVVAR